MSPKISASRLVKPSSDVYTALLAIAFGAVTATAGFVAYMCYTQYNTLFEIIERIR